LKKLFVEQNAYFYICGAMAMGKDVQHEIEIILGEDGAKKVKDMEKEKRYVKELWG
jgi:sulfite reductase alpha subunit-like flavoprotein